MKFGKVKIACVAMMILAVLLTACAQTGTNTGSSSGTGSSKGRTVFAMKDAATNMESVTSVKTTVDSVKVHSQAEGWTTVSSSAHTYDLMELKSEGNTALLADANLKEGTYDEVQMHISRVVVTDAKGTHEAKMPSNDYKITGRLLVKAESTSTATFDFIADESLHATSDGNYVVAPVVEYETKSDATVDVRSSSDVQISGGKTTTDIKVGMDINGNVGIGLKILSNANLSVDSLGKIRVAGTGSGGLGISG